MTANTVNNKKRQRNSCTNEHTVKPENDRKRKIKHRLIIICDTNDIEIHMHKDTQKIQLHTKGELL